MNVVFKRSHRTKISVLCKQAIYLPQKTVPNLFQLQILYINPHLVEEITNGRAK